MSSGYIRVEVRRPGMALLAGMVAAAIFGSAPVLASNDAGSARLWNLKRVGAQAGIDYEGERDEWLKYNIICRKGSDGHMEVEQLERSAPPKYLSDIANSKIEDLESGKVGADAPND